MKKAFSVEKIDQTNKNQLSVTMAKLRPNWWKSDLEAIEAINSREGWILKTSETKIVGWLLFKRIEDYGTVEIDNLGYDNNEEFAVGFELQPLLEICDKWAQENNFVNLRFTISSRNTSIHDREIFKPWEELMNLKVYDRSDYDLFIKLGFKPFGILPEIYGKGCHGLMLIKII